VRLKTSGHSRSGSRWAFDKKKADHEIDVEPESDFGRSSDTDESQNETPAPNEVVVEEPHEPEAQPPPVESFKARQERARKIREDDDTAVLTPEEIRSVKEMVKRERKEEREKAIAVMEREVKDIQEKANKSQELSDPSDRTHPEIIVADTRSAAQFFMESKYGVIVNIASYGGPVPSEPYTPRSERRGYDSILSGSSSFYETDSAPKALPAAADASTASGVDPLLSQKNSSHKSEPKTTYFSLPKTKYVSHIDETKEPGQRCPCIDDDRPLRREREASLREREASLRERELDLADRERRFRDMARDFWARHGEVPSKKLEDPRARVPRKNELWQPRRRPVFTDENELPEAPVDRSRNPGEENVDEMAVEDVGRSARRWRSDDGNREGGTRSPVPRRQT
jgi:hypothetical protein